MQTGSAHTLYRRHFAPHTTVVLNTWNVLQQDLLLFKEGAGVLIRKYHTTALQEVCEVYVVHLVQIVYTSTYGTLRPLCSDQM